MPNHNADLQKFLKSVKKSELHLHLTGSYPLWYLKQCATDAALLAVYENFVIGLDILAQGVSYHEGFKYFAPVEKLVNTYEKVETGVVALAEELQADGVVYVEIRAGLKDLGKGHEEYLRAILRGIQNSPAGIKINLLLSLRRDTTAEMAAKTVDLAMLYRQQGVVGIDISGNSTVGQISVIMPAIERAKQAGLFVALHLGESLEEIDTPEKQLEQALVLQKIKPHRVGHGVYLSPQALTWILAHPLVPIEVCPTSSVLAGMIDHHADHPGIEYYLQHQHPIVIGTDDPLLFRSPLSMEYCKLMQLENINIDQVLQMIDWSFDFAFLSPTERFKLRNSSMTLKSRM